MSTEKTEEPTAKKLKEARRRGQVGKSRELAGAATLLAAAGMLVAIGPSMGEGLGAIVKRAMGLTDSPLSLLAWATQTAGGLVFPFLAAVLVAGVAAHVLQTGPVLADKALEPKFERLNVVKGLGQLFTRRKLVELLKTLLIVGALGYVLVGVLESGVRPVSALASQSPSAFLQVLGELGSRLVFRVGACLLVLGIADLLYQRWQHRRDQRMSKEEVKREHRDAEGDPQTQAERSRLRREIAEHDALAEVHKADVLVVNPTHLAVALRYDEEDDESPRVLSKGSDHLAKRMIEEAQRAGVPIMRDVPLARALFELSHGDEIPEALFEAAAAVLRAAWGEAEA
ncbi:MAG: EscU/YscU/HrcU family type III secretion system export apparatus switch protein, partial [Myxococcota bacterium]